MDRDDTEMLRAARTLAQESHAGQTYGDPVLEIPYSFHLAQVVGTLLRFGVTEPDLLAAGWLHDVLEDTDASTAAVRFATNDRVTTLVTLLTDGEGQNRAQRRAVMLARLAAWPSADDRSDAVTVKLADRLANVEASLLSADKRLLMYAKEHPAFAEAVKPFVGGQGHALLARLNRIFTRVKS